MPPRLVAALCVCFLLLACTSSPPPHVVIVVLDTLRADRVGAYGNERGLTPFIDSLAERGALFRRTRATSSWTIPSIATLFTSRHASQHRVVAFESVLDDSEVTLAERLHAAGYATGGFTANYRLAKQQGYAQGFFRWVDDKSLQKIRAPAIQAHAVDWLDKVAAARPDAPILLYLHYMEPHTPYEPPDTLRKRFASPEDHAQVPDALNQAVIGFKWETLDASRTERVRNLYDGEVAAADQSVAAIFGELERRGILQNAFVVVTSDHGEEFGEHGSFLHGRALYEESVRVPLILVPPAGRTDLQGVVVDDDVSLIDVAPTLLHVLGLSPEPRFEGHSLLPLVRGHDKGRDVRIELLKMDTEDARLHSGGLIQGRLKLLFDPAGTPSLYDLHKDPDEREPDARPEARAALVSAFENERRDLVSRAVEDPQTNPLDEATRERLRALGYIAE